MIEIQKKLSDTLNLKISTELRAHFFSFYDFYQNDIILIKTNF